MFWPFRIDLNFEKYQSGAGLHTPDCYRQESGSCYKMLTFQYCDIGTSPFDANVCCFKTSIKQNCFNQMPN